MRQCSESDCDKPHIVRGLCRPHYMRAWRQANREQQRIYKQAYRRSDPEKNRKHRRNYLDRRLVWVRANPGEAQAYNRRKRARRLGAGGVGVSEAEWAALVEAASACCFYCGEHGPLVMDHVIPLTPRNGDEPGQHSFENVLPACGLCNGSKHNRPLNEWYGPSAPYLRRRHRRLVRQARVLLDAWDAA